MKFDVTTRIHDLGDGQYALDIECLDESALEFFEEQGYDGNGYTWHAIVDALGRTRLGDRHKDLSFSPEAESLLVTSSDMNLLAELEAAVAVAASSLEGIQGLLRVADEELLE